MAESLAPVALPDGSRTSSEGFRRAGATLAVAVTQLAQRLG